MTLRIFAFFAFMWMCAVFFALKTIPSDQERN